MIREFVNSAHEKVVGALRSTFSGLIGTILRNENLMPLVYVLVMTVVAGGLVNGLVQLVPNQGYLVYPESGYQTIAETILDSFVILLGGAGIYLTFMSGRQTTRPRAVNMYLALALLLLVISVLAGIQVVQLKGS